MTSSDRALMPAPHANGAHVAPGDAHVRLRAAIARFDAAARARVVSASVEVETLAITVSSHLQERAVAAVKVSVRDNAWLLLGAACLAGAFMGQLRPRRRPRR